MIFDVAPRQIECLDSKQLVELLRKLLHAEALRTGISLSGISVPPQINVRDGGEDARISWKNGAEKTDYLPCRFCIFQSKATDIGPAGWKKEVWTKASQKKSAKKKQLNSAVKKLIPEKGAYIGFTSAILIGDKYDNSIDSIKNGVKEAGADPDQLAEINIYDANKIAAWASRYPAVAVWLNELQSGLQLRTFQTIPSLGNKADIASIPIVDDEKERFLIGNKDIVGQSEQDQAKNVLSFQGIKERIVEHLLNPGSIVRIIGSSGVGKTRFIYEVLKDKTTLAKLSLATLAIYCDFRDIGQNIFNTVHVLVTSDKSALMIVDDCTHDVAQRIYEIAVKQPALRIVTIGHDDCPIRDNKCLNISVTPAADTLIEGIIRKRLSKADDGDVSFIKNLSGGFPRIAVIATNNYSENLPILKSIDDVVERILSGSNVTNVDQIRAVESLALFERLGADEELSDYFEIVAKTFARQSSDEMYEHLVQASKHSIVDRRGRYFAVQPLPIAVFLGARRLDLLRAKTILQFIETAPQGLVTSFFARWRHFGVSEILIRVSEKLLEREGKLGTFDALNTEFGSLCFNELVHVNPDAAADTIKRVFLPLSIDDLTKIQEGRRNLMWALEKLVFRNSSFPVAARLLMRLAAVENENIGNNATGQFNQLFQLQLSGTEAEPHDRFVVLDEGIQSEDERIISVCVEALEKTLDRGHYSRFGGAEQIGIQPPLKDWRPKLWSEVFSFQRNGLQRLNDIRSKCPKFASRCEQIIATNTRMLLCENLFNDIEKIIIKIAKEKGIWLEAIESLGDWLYFDRKGAPAVLSRKIRKLYDSLLPTDLVEKALLYTKFWPADIRDPDIDYVDESGKTMDFEYSTRKAIEVAALIAKEKKLVDRVIRTMAVEELNNVFPFAHELATKVDDPIETFKTVVQAYEGQLHKGNLQFIRGMLAGVDKRDKVKASICIKIALASDALKNQIINIYTAVEISDERLLGIIEDLKAGKLTALDCLSLSYGRVLYHLDPGSILPLMDELAENHGADGIWTAIQIAFMFQYQRSALDQRLADRLKQYVASPKILEKTVKGSRDGYQLEEVVKLIHKYYEINDEFAAAIGKQITILCQVDDFEIFSALDEPARKILKLLVKENPLPLWQMISRFFEMATPLELHRLERLIGPSMHGSDDNFHQGEGALFGIPDAVCIDWAKADPVKRAPFLCLFYPLFEANTYPDHKWHPRLEGLTHEFGSVKEFRQAIARRFHPRSWWGSILPHLKVYLKPLETWFMHSDHEMALWAREMHRSIKKQIELERRKEEERL